MPCQGGDKVLSRFLIVCVLLPIGLSLVQAQAADSEDLVHTVAAGDTLISIAHAYGVTLDQLLTLNSLQAETLLQIGQRLLVIRAANIATDASDAEDAGDESEPDSGGEGGEIAIGGNVEVGEWPPAPVTEADAPMRDPADMSAQLCFAVFQDDNQNGQREPGEILLHGATIDLLGDGIEARLQYRTDGEAEPFCPAEMEREIYWITGNAPPAYGLTSAGELRIDLRAGGRLTSNSAPKRACKAPRSRRLICRARWRKATVRAREVFCAS